MADVAIGRAERADPAETWETPEVHGAHRARDRHDHEGNGTRGACCVDGDPRRSSPLDGHRASPATLPAGLPVLPDDPDGLARVGWLLRFQVVTLVMAAILCGLATAALLALSWSFFAQGALLAPCGVCISCIHVIALPVAGTV